MTRRSRAARKSAFVMIYAMFAVIALMAFTSLAVDFGRVQTAKTELLDATDAAARYAVTGLIDNTYLAKAQQAALNNNVDGSSLTLTSSDVEVGYWDPTHLSFVNNGTPRNAVRVWGRRTAARGSAVPLVFGRVIGIATCDVNEFSVVRQSSLGAVGINSVTLTGSGIIRRKSTESGGVTAASNGAWTLSTLGTISGDTMYRTTAPSGGTISGTKMPLSSDFTYPMPTVPGTLAYSVSGAFTLNYNQSIGGNCYVNGNLWVTSGGVVTLLADTYIYCTGTITVDGTATIATNGHKLYFISTGVGNVVFANTTAITCAVYSPNAAVSINGTGVFSGSAVGKTLTVGGILEYTATLPIPYKPTGGSVSMGTAGSYTVQ